MRRSPLWREFESGDGLVLLLLRSVVIGGGLLFLCFSAVLPLNWERQLLFAAVTIAVAVSVHRASKSHLGTLTLLLLSIFSSFRYLFWRASSSIAFWRDPLSRWTAWDVVFIVLLLCAELYAAVTMLLGYVQVLWPLRRSPVPLPEDPNDWPAVDVLIPTYNEPLAVIRPTALAAMNIDWPADRLNVYILDDGNREQVRAFAEEAGIGYIARTERTHAKAGNINNALGQVSSPYVVVFDCDHVPTRSFLQVTMGWMLRDARLAILQTPHHFYSPDPFERNLNQFRAVPTETQLYYRVVQDGNDFWNAASFCGSCAVLRRVALNEVGGFAVETVTEDAHTSLRMQMRGWNTGYINIPQAGGLATERLKDYIRQRIRWARGMLHILRLDNPLFAPGLSAGQRLCYFHAMSHFLFALPRLVFLTAPLMYLLLGRVTIPGLWIAIVAYALPHLALASIGSRRIHGEHRDAWWDHVYETVAAPFLVLPTMKTLFSARPQEFSVTAKGGVVEQDYFDGRIAWPFLVLLTANLLGLASAIPRLFRFPVFNVAGWASFLNWPAALYAPNVRGIVAVNLAWVLFNIVLLGVAIAVAQEKQQRRGSVRLSVALPSDIILPDGAMLQGVTSDLSNGGVRARTPGGIRIKPGDQIKFVFPLLDGTATISARAVDREGNELRARFDSLTVQEHEALATLLYSRADSWLDWRTRPAQSSGFASLRRLVRIAFRTMMFRRSGKATVAGILLLVAGIAMAATAAAQTDTVPPPSVAEPAAPAPTGPAKSATSPSPGSAFRPLRKPAPATPSSDFAQVINLGELTTPADLMLRGPDTTHSVRFFIARDRLVRVADLKLRYRTAPGLIAAASHLVVTLNGTVVATLPVSTNPVASTDTTLTVPADLLKHENRLGFELIGHYSAQCEDPANASVWAQIDPTSTIELSGSRLSMTNDLASLPLPFYDAGGNKRPAVPIVFAATPSPEALQAAAIIASWFGALAAPRQIRFPVSLGTIPAGNAIVLAERSTQLLGESQSSNTGPTIAIQANPADPTSSVLVVSGNTSSELLTAARALVLHQKTWQGPRVVIRDFNMPPARKPGDAPRWLRTDAAQTFADMSRLQPESLALTADALQTDGSTPVTVRFMLPPDLDFGDRENLPLRLDYRYNSVPLGQGSTLQVYLNGAFISSTPMPHADRASRVLETIIPVPVAGLRPGPNEFQFRFAFQRASAGNCPAPAPQNLVGAIEPDSSLDITGISHSTLLPKLQLFTSAGFPFTRLADLSETTVVVPSQSTNTELELLLLLLGRFGAQTGYPALRVTIANTAGLAADRSHDYLILGMAQDQPALQSMAGAAPVVFDASGIHMRPAPGLLNRRRWLSSPPEPETGEVSSYGGTPDAVIEEFNWPGSSNRTAVAIILRDDTAAQQFATALNSLDDSNNIGDAATVLRGARFTPLAVSVAQYRVGENTFIERATRALQQFPWLVAVVAVIFCFLIAVLLQARLRRKARLRLQVTE